MELKIKAILRWEQIKNKSFSNFDSSDIEDIELLIYTMSEKKVTFEVFKNALGAKIRKDMYSDLNKLMKYIAQFQSENNTEEDPGNQKIGDIISSLILSGLDPHYALNEMELFDLPVFISAYERKKKEEMENSRLWTYLSMLPHIDAKKMKNGAKDLMIFPWEQAEIDTEKEIKDEEIEKFENFMKNGKELFK